MTAPPDSRLASLSPAYFGLVMATGIVAIAAHLAGWVALAQSLSAIGIAAFAVLWALNFARAWRHGDAMRADFSDHLRGPGYFTWVAATAVVGAQAIVLLGRRDLAWVLWCVALALWALLTYGIFAALTVKAQKPPLERGINGGWLLAVVATQSIAVLSALLAPGATPAAKLPLNFLALSMWLAGGMLYVWIVALIFQRYMFLKLAAEDFTAPYWINMGAMAISTLAGSLLAAASHDAPLLQSLAPFVKGFTILYWATATWWIPMLLVLVAWRYGLNRFPLRYDPMYWGAVFPLGMYSAATHEMGLVLGLGFLAPVAGAFLVAALAAWAAAFVGMLRQLATAIRRTE